MPANIGRDVRDREAGHGQQLPATAPAAATRAPRERVQQQRGGVAGRVDAAKPANAAARVVPGGGALRLLAVVSAQSERPEAAVGRAEMIPVPISLSAASPDLLPPSTSSRNALVHAPTTTSVRAG